MPPLNTLLLETCFLHMFENCVGNVPANIPAKMYIYVQEDMEWNVPACVGKSIRRAGVFSAGVRNICSSSISENVWET